MCLYLLTGITPGEAGWVTQVADSCKVLASPRFVPRLGVRGPMTRSSGCLNGGSASILQQVERELQQAEPPATFIPKASKQAVHTFFMAMRLPGAL